tara:strand:+ start:508 stop:828 length:321 start_codon:yes stop_codon:yes gene_type:complete
MAYQAGRLNERIHIEVPKQTRNSLGEAHIEWHSFDRVYASVDGMRSKEILQAMQANVIATHKITIRYRDGIDHKARITWRGRTMEIASVVERHRRTCLELLVREVT